jgi:tripartite-type tricarboxylate transporter receptor subunit TctC
MYRDLLLLAFASISITHAQSAPAVAQDYPSKPIRMIVPWAAGGTSDVAGRIVAQKLSVRWSNQVFVENRPGAGGTIGTAVAAKSSPDGYSLLMGSSTELVVSPHVYKTAAYNPLTDFVPIAYVAAQPLVLVVNPQLPVKSVQELIALAKSQPGSINCSSSGTGSTLHIAQLLFENAAQVKFFHVPYSGSPQAATSTVTGEKQVHFGSLTAVLELVRNGNLRGLAVTGSKRSAALPDLPTVAEAGGPDFEIVIWNALFGPRNTPSEIVGKLNFEMDRLLETPDIREAFRGLSMDISPMSREQLGTMVAAEWTRMGKVVAASGAKID